MRNVCDFYGNMLNDLLAIIFEYWRRDRQRSQSQHNAHINYYHHRQEPWRLVKLLHQDKIFIWTMSINQTLFHHSYRLYFDHFNIWFPSDTSFRVIIFHRFFSFSLSLARQTSCRMSWFLFSLCRSSNSIIFRCIRLFCSSIE